MTSRSRAAAGGTERRPLGRFGWFVGAPMSSAGSPDASSARRRVVVGVVGVVVCPDPRPPRPSPRCRVVFLLAGVGALDVLGALGLFGRRVPVGTSVPSALLGSSGTSGPDESSGTPASSASTSWPARDSFSCGVSVMLTSGLGSAEVVLTPIVRRIRGVRESSGYVQRGRSDGAVEADGLAVEHRVVDDVRGQLGELRRVAEPARVRHLAAEGLAGCLRAAPRAAGCGTTPARW